MSVPRKQDGWRPGTPQDLEAMYHFKQRFRELKMLLELIESGKLDMKVIRGLLPPEMDSDAANKKYVDQKDTEVKTYVDAGLAGKAPAGFGLGETVKWIYAPEKLADYIHSGFYSWASGVSDAPFNAGSMIVIKRSELYVYQVAFRDDITRVVIAVRKLTNTTWSEWVDYSPSAFAPAGFGLEATTRPPNNSLDELHTNGWYQCGSGFTGAPTGHNNVEYGTVFVINRYGKHTTQYYVTQPESIVGSPLMLVRNYSVSTGTWNPWEWINPPLASGVEYRTTERINGAAVYKRRNSSGIIEYRLDGETTWRKYPVISGAIQQSANYYSSGKSADDLGLSDSFALIHLSTSENSQLYSIFACTYAYVLTFYYASIAQRAQIAISYTGTPKMAIRTSYAGNWTQWTPINTGAGVEFDTGAINVASGSTWTYNGNASKFYNVTVQIGSTAYRHTFVVDWAAVNSDSDKQIGYYSDANGSKLNLVVSISGTSISFKPSGCNIVHIRGYY